MLRRYRGSHGLDLADALIAVTALLHGLQIVIPNREHFPTLGDLMMPY